VKSTRNRWSPDTLQGMLSIMAATLLSLWGHSCLLYHSRSRILYRTLLQVILPQTLKRLTHRILSLESATNPEGADDE
jgi:hypothetical protein